MGLFCQLASSSTEREARGHRGLRARWDSTVIAETSAFDSGVHDYVVKSGASCSLFHSRPSPGRSSKNGPSRERLRRREVSPRGDFGVIDVRAFGVAPDVFCELGGVWWYPHRAELPSGARGIAHRGSNFHHRAVAGDFATAITGMKASQILASVYASFIID